MTENENSPENLRKFLESDDPAMVRMGISMAKSTKISDDLLALICGLHMWHDDKAIRAAAKSVFNKYAPDELKQIIKATWNTSYRKGKTEQALLPKVEAMLRGFKDTLLETVNVWKPALSRTSGDRISIVRVLAGSDNMSVHRYRGVEPQRIKKIRTIQQELIGFGVEAVKPLIKALRDDDWEVRYWSAYALGKIGDGRAIESLIDALSDEDRRVRWIVGDALGDIGDSRGLIKALEDDDEHVRKSAAEALWKLGEAAVKPLTELLEDEDYDVCETAKKTLRKLGHEVE